MADKGGNGTPFNSRGKGIKKTVAPPKQGTMKGKDGSVGKKAEPVQLDSSDSDFEGFVEEKSPNSMDLNGTSLSGQKSGKKVSFENPKTGGKGDWGKGGKGSSMENSGWKGSLPNSVVTEVELKLELDIPKGARILMDCEAAEILQDIQESVTVLSKDPKIKMPESFIKGVQYSKVNHHYKKVKSVRELLEPRSLKMHGATDGEICMIGNVCPETIEEVYALIPSLKANKHKNENAIKDVLSELAKLKIPK